MSGAALALNIKQSIISVYLKRNQKSPYKLRYIFKVIESSRPQGAVLFGEYIVTDNKGLIDKIIPFFKKYPIIGVKAMDFADFCEAAELVKNKDHLTKEGLDRIRLIKMGMNKKRQ